MRPATYAAPQRIEDDALDYYGKRGVVLSRDAGHRALAALRRDAYDLRTRPCEANNAAADEQDALAKEISHALARS